MDNIRLTDTGRLRRINSRSYIKCKLFVLYLVLSAFCLYAGGLLYRNNFVPLPQYIPRGITSLFLTPAKNDTVIDIISSIVYNSVDIFKITFIIIVSGFTYISSIISKIAVTFGSLHGGFVLYCCLSGEISKGHTKLAVIICATVFLYWMIFLCGCVRAEIYSHRFSEFHNSNVLLTSDFFWKYISGFLIDFGYVLIIRALYSFILKLFV